MALLYRFTKLNDRHNTGIFTFIVTRSVTRDLHRDATTKDFYYGYHRWAISFQRANDKALGVFLILRNPSPSTKCYADFTLTLLNREHFSRNEQHTEKQCKFTVDHTTQGVSKWIMLSEIQSRKFGDETGEFLLELSLGNIMTIFETDLQLSSGGPPKSGKFESGSFGFGYFDWNVSIVVHNYAAGSGNAAPNSNNGNGPAEENISGRIIYVFLNRLSGFDHPCRVQYRVIIGESKNREDSGILDQISDAGGRIRGFQMQHSLMDYLKPNGSVRVHVELHCCNAISEAKVPIVRNPSPAVNCYDRNKQGWCIEADLDSEFLRLKLFFMDLHSVPRNHLRYISWIAYVIAKEPRHGGRESLAVSNAPHSNYYIQDGIDMGAMMDTTLTVAKIKEQPKIYLESDNKLTVHVEWCDSIMLFNHIYHKYDDITRIHCHQMRREISALSSENYSLEKQLVSYQKSVGSVPPRSSSKDNGSETGSVRGVHHTHLAQRSSSEVHLNDHSSNANASVTQRDPSVNPSVGQSMANHVSGSHGQFQSAGQVSQAHHQSIERRSVGSGGSGSMLGLPSSATSSGPASPLHSPLANTRNFHQMPRGGSLHRAEYHHQLPAIPAQAQTGGGSHHQAMFHGSPQMKARPTHYGSLQMNSLHDSLFDDEEYLSASQTSGVGNLTPPRLARSAHRSRERTTYQQAPLAQQQATFGVTSYSQSLPGAPYHQLGGGQLPPPQAYPVPPHSPVPLGMLNATNHANGWSSHANGTKLISPGYYEHL